METVIGVLSFLTGLSIGSLVVLVSMSSALEKGGVLKFSRFKEEE